MISLIAACGKNRVIGKDNKLPWHLPADLKYFKETTMGKTVVMGRRTYESIGKPLPGRENIVLSKNKFWTFGSNIKRAFNIETVLNSSKDKDIFIIGGEQIYKEFFPYADKIYLTFIHSSFEGDSKFPFISADDWELDNFISNDADELNKYDYSFCTFIKKHK